MPSGEDEDPESLLDDFSSDKTFVDPALLSKREDPAEMADPVVVRITEPSSLRSASRRRPIPLSVAGSGPAAAGAPPREASARKAPRPLSTTPLPKIGAPPQPPAAAPQSKAAALRSLTIDHSGAAIGRSPARSKFPWILLALVIAGGAYVHFRPAALPGLDGIAPPSTAKTNGPQRRIQRISPSAAPTDSMLAAGYMAAKDPITVGVTLSGRVKKLHVANGDRVKKGQVMVQVEDSQILAQLRLAMAKEKDAARALSRVRALAKVEAATAVDLENAIGKYEIAAAERRVSAALLEETRVRAPTDGTILEVLCHVGEVLTVAPNVTTAVVRFADLRAMVAEIDVNEADVSRVRMHQSAEIAADAQPGRKYSASVFEIGLQADRARGTVLVRLDVERINDGSLKPGMAVRARFLEDKDRKPSILIPRGALDLGAVWVVDNSGVVSRRAVVTEAAGPNMFEVSKGLGEGEQVVVEGWAGLHEGDHIEP
jgi:membrane fusion protein, multidrug efflux system